jgi:hypothetical protein
MLQAELWPPLCRLATIATTAPPLPMRLMVRTAPPARLGARTDRKLLLPSLSRSPVSGAFNLSSDCAMLQAELWPPPRRLATMATTAPPLPMRLMPRVAPFCAWARTPYRFPKLECVEALVQGRGACA